MSSNKINVICGYRIEDRLGSGSFATVFKGELLKQSSNQLNSFPRKRKANVVAIKAISKNSEKVTSSKLLENLEMEISMLESFRHNNIVCMQEVEKTEKYIYLVLEYCGGGDVQKLIRSRKKGRLSEGLTRRLVRDLSGGLKYLWGREVIHRDIKPQNLLLTGLLPLDETNDPAQNDKDEERRRNVNYPTEKFHLKIADFGFARHLTTTNLAETLCGSPLYMAPEILQHQRYDAKADLWSVGTVVFEMLAGFPPFTGHNHIDLLKNIQRKAVRLPKGLVVSSQAIALLRILLNKNPLSRAGFQQFFDAAEEFVKLGCNPTTTTSCVSPTPKENTSRQFGKSPSSPSAHPLATNSISNQIAFPSKKSFPLHPISSSPPLREASQPMPVGQLSPPPLQLQQSIPSSSQHQQNSDENDFVMVEKSMARTIRVPQNLLSTSPNTGAALLQAMNNQNQSLTLSKYTQQAPDIKRILAAAQDVGRRAVHIAHVGDTRAFLAMDLMHQDSNEICPTNPFSNGLDQLTEVENEDDDMPFAISSSSPQSAQPQITSSLPHQSLIHQHLREALSCYIKALNLFKSALKASQLSQDQLTISWLTSQFDGVLERADAANNEMNKLLNNSNCKKYNLPPAEQLIYYHALAAGKDGAVKQLLGQNEAAKASYHTAVLLTESLLMDHNNSIYIKDENSKAILQNYIQEFLKRLNEIEMGNDDDDDDEKVVTSIQQPNSTFERNNSSNDTIFQSLVPPIPFVSQHSNNNTKMFS